MCANGVNRFYTNPIKRRVQIFTTFSKLKIENISINKKIKVDLIFSEQNRLTLLTRKKGDWGMMRMREPRRAGKAIQIPVVTRQLKYLPLKIPRDGILTT